MRSEDFATPADQLPRVPRKLDCPECGEPLIPANARIHFFFEHGDGFDVHEIDCLCDQCEWAWLEGGDPATCACGAVAKVGFGDDDSDSSAAHYAYAQLVSPAPDAEPA